jgi:hypothetical protein
MAVVAVVEAEGTRLERRKKVVEPLAAIIDSTHLHSYLSFIGRSVYLFFHLVAYPFL